jgi:hypothetical protein
LYPEGSVPASPTHLPAGMASPGASLPLSADIHLHVLNNSCDRMYLLSTFSGDGHLMTASPCAGLGMTVADLEGMRGTGEPCSSRGSSMACCCRSSPGRACPSRSETNECMTAGLLRRSLVRDGSQCQPTAVCMRMTVLPWATRSSPGRLYSRSNTTLCISLAALNTKYTGWRQNGFNVH